MFVMISSGSKVSSSSSAENKKKLDRNKLFASFKHTDQILFGHLISQAVYCLVIKEQKGWDNEDFINIYIHTHT